MNGSIRLGTKTITKLTDAAQALFSLLYGLENEYQAQVKRQQQSEFMDLDVFRNDTRHEEPDDWR